MLDNRRVYAELEARLLTGETLRVHHYQCELADYTTEWQQANWIIYKQTWMYVYSLLLSIDYDSIDIFQWQTI
jgi:hypothetical protein